MLDHSDGKNERYDMPSVSVTVIMLLIITEAVNLVKSVGLQRAV